jgi:hypothetical protein
MIYYLMFLSDVTWSLSLQHYATRGRVTLDESLNGSKGLLAV